MDLEALYRHRFDEDDLPAKLAIWNVLCEDFFSKFITSTDTVIDVGAGYCEFINNVKCKRRIAIDLNPRLKDFASSEVEIRNESCTNLTSIADGIADVVFMSNFLEHLPSKQLVLDTLVESKRILRAGGKLIILQPNVRFLPGAYWDFFDHHTPLTERSLVEAVTSIDLEPILVIAKFLPYTTKSVLPQSPWLVRLYLKFPLAWKVLGKQSLVVAEKK